MKKIFTIILFINILLLTGCGKDNYFTCKINIDNDMEEYKLNAEYKIYYKNSFVTRIEKEEIYISENEDILQYFDEYKNLEYNNLNKLYGGITYTVNLIDNKVILFSDIDMSLVDIEKMVKNKYIDKDYVVSNRLTTGGIKYIYKAKGATCDI